MAKTSNNRRTDLLLKIFLAFVLFFAGVRIVMVNIVQPLAVEESITPLRARFIFANCLKNHSVIMYGVDTCEFCKAQKKMFGDDFREITYVNCDFSLDLCHSKGVTHFPAWEIRGNMVYGLQTFQQLGALTSCQVPT